MYIQLKNINKKPKVFGDYTAEALWNDPYSSQQMLKYHLNPDIALASRTHDFIDSSVAWIKKHFFIDEETSICDFGCGPGLYTSRFAQISKNVTGLDFSKSSIKYAKKYAQDNNLKVDYHLGNYLEFQSDKRFDLIMMIMCDFCALSPFQREQLLQVFHKHLKDDGKIILDVYSLNAYQNREEQSIYEHNQLNGFWSHSDYYAFVNTFKYDEEKVILDKYNIYEANGNEKIIFNWLQYYDSVSLSNELKKSDFLVDEYFSDVSGRKFSEASSEFAIVLKKK